jgi:hypothetical protein
MTGKPHTNKGKGDPLCLLINNKKEVFNGRKKTSPILKKKGQSYTDLEEYCSEVVYQNITSSPGTLDFSRKLKYNP